MRKSFIYRPVSSRVQGSGFRVQESKFIPHPSSLIPHPSSSRLQPTAYSLRPGYTLVEILVATAITLLLMGVVVQLFGSLGQSITDSRSILEASDRLRSAAARLQMDLQGVTVTMLPPRNPDDGEGYFEYIEGPVMQSPTGDIGGPPLPVNSELAGSPTDTTVGDFDDILMFTTRSTDKPFTGTFSPDGGVSLQSVQSDVAEVAWFIRGRTLYRRQLLVSPGLWNNLASPVLAQGFYVNSDISVRANQVSGVWLAIPNTLSDLTRRECRFAHPTNTFPFDARYWGQLGLPTLRECSDPGWYAGVWDPLVMKIGLPSALATVDFWSNDPSARFSDSAIINNASTPASTYQGTRVADDVILTNVIGFDVKAWDPGANGGVGGYVDLGYENRPSSSEIKHYPQDLPIDAPNYAGELFYHRGHTASMLFGDFSNDSSSIFYDNSRVYDTWSTHYENVGLYDPAQTKFPIASYPPGRGVNGFDDNGDGIVDDDNEKLTSPPYTAPLRGIQVKIRVFEPDSRQVRELTIVQEFLPK